jgi:hypothetical protein
MVSLQNLDVLTLSPCISKHENVISTDTQHDENNDLVQGRVVGDSKNSSVDQLGQGERENDLEHSHRSQEERS